MYLSPLRGGGLVLWGMQQRSKLVASLGLFGLLTACPEQAVQTNNTAPEVVIIEPAPDFQSTVGDAVTFRGEVRDSGTTSSEIEVGWSSSRDGVVFEGFASADGGVLFSTDALQAGEHTITLRAIDSVGASATDAVAITVSEAETPNTNPTCAITHPEDDAELLEGDTVVFEGFGEDGESDSDDLVSTWASSEDGELGVAGLSSSGAVALPVDGLSSGTHVVTFDVADPEGGN